MNYEKWLERKGLRYLNGELLFDEVNVNELIKEYDTPVYVVSERIIRERYRELKSLINSYYKKNSIHFAIKANSNLSILKILHSEGSSFDCSSVGEIHACLKVNINPNKIIYTGNMFTNDDLEFAVKNGVIINLDSLSQLYRLNKIYDKLNEDKDLISFRINPEFGAGHHSHTITAGKDVKFGLLKEQVIRAYSLAKKFGFKRFGIHQHIGSGILDVRDFELATREFLDIIENLVDKLSIEFEFIDIGGGLGIPYKPEEKPLDLKLYGKLIINFINERIKKLGIFEPELKIEPGRFLCAESSVILTRINTIKFNGYKYFAGVDAGFNTLIRPILYGSYHHIIPCNIKIDAEKVKYDVVGPICESGDVFGKERELQKLEEGDLLAILDAGAYGFTMSSNYNSRPRPAEILIKNGKTYQIREAETLEDLFKFQKIPKYLLK